MIVCIYGCLYTRKERTTNDVDKKKKQKNKKNVK